ncbi:MAG: hypothetical protein HZB67_03705, partial [Candidatus Aenigmarchaeota archaeon]|nr:hypothetical protein [Candidatus Aenigmarchaeota archaeon]
MMERQTVFIGLVLVGLLLFGCVQSPSGTTTTTQKTTSTITPTSTSISPTSTTLSQSSDNQWKYQFYDSAKFFSGIPLGWNEVSIQNPMVTGVNLINNA